MSITPISLLYFVSTFVIFWVTSAFELLLRFIDTLLQQLLVNFLISVLLVLLILRVVALASEVDGFDHFFVAASIFMAELFMVI